MESDSSITTLRPQRRDTGLYTPATGAFCRMPHDWELAQYDYGLRPLDQVIPYPSTRQFWKKPDFVTVPFLWAWRWVEMIEWAAGYRITRIQAMDVWRSLIANHTFLTDGHAPENGYHDPVTGENPGAPNVEMNTLGMTGNILRLTGTNGRYLTIAACDFSKDPPSLETLIQSRWLWGWATEQGLIKTAKGYTVAPFPHLKNVTGITMGIPAPIVSTDGEQWVNPEDVERIGNGVSYSAYEPEI